VIFASPGEYEVDVSVDFSLDTASKLRGQLWFPTQQVQRYETLDLVLRGPAISFKVRDENNVISFFDGEIDSAEAKITGRLTEGFQRVPFTLRQRIDHPSAPAVIRLADDGSGLREAFNRAAGHVRLLMILSPSAFSSRMALKLVQRYVLDANSDPRIKIFVIWEPVYSSDSENAAQEAASLLADSRVSHYWSASRFVGNSFRNLLENGSGPLWDAHLVFSGDKQWTGTVPRPNSFRVAPRHGTSIPEKRKMNGVSLGRDISALLLGA